MTRGSNMIRETLMVLKRLIVTTLGLGALLAAGAVSAQNQIPTPEDLTAPGAAPIDTGACTAVMELDAMTAADTDVVNVTVCTGEMAAAAKPVVDARLAQVAVGAAQDIVDSAKTVLDNAKRGADEAAIAAAQNTFDVANTRLTAAKAVRDKLGADSPLAQATLDEAMAIQTIAATETSSTTADTIRDATATSLAALEFDTDGNNVSSW